MTFDEIIVNHASLTLGDLGDLNSNAFFDAVSELGLQDTFTPDTPMKDVAGLIAALPADVAEKLRSVDFKLDPTPQPGSTDSAAPGVEDLKAIGTLSPRESIGRLIVGSLFCLVMAFTIITFTIGITLVAIHRMEFPSTTLCAVIVLPTMYVAWFYMGIINKERRDILSALVGSKISPSVITSIIDAIKKPRV